MANTIPFRPSIGRYRFVTVIDDVQYIFRVRWNSRMQAWFFSVYEFDETPIVEGIRVVLGTYLGRWSNHPLFLRGVMLARSRVAPHRDPGFDDLGVSVQVYYMNRADQGAQTLGSISPVPGDDGGI